MMYHSWKTYAGEIPIIKRNQKEEQKKKDGKKKKKKKNNIKLINYLVGSQ